MTMTQTHKDQEATFDEDTRCGSSMMSILSGSSLQTVRPCLSVQALPPTVSPLHHIVHVTKILFSRPTGVEAWITSDGRVYFVRLDQNPLHGIEKGVVHPVELEPESSEDHLPSAPTPPSQTIWTGTPIHTFQTPRWVEKQRRVDPSEQLHPPREAYEEPRRATEIAINGRFSVVAVGMARFVFLQWN